MRGDYMNEKIDSMKNLVELHIHLDGALSVDNCKKLASIQGINIPSDEEVLNLLTVSPDCHDLNEFLTKFEFPLTLLQSSLGIKCALKNLQDELIEQGLVYAEIRFAPQLHTRNGLSQEDVIVSAINGLDESSLKCNLILCCMRGDGNHSENMETVRLAKKYLGKGVCAIDLAGAEGLYPTKNFSDIFAYARELGVPFTIHAGEADGPSSVSDAISFGAKRIGHGVRSYEDLELVKKIASLGITLEVCPTSNICTCIYNKISDMPIKYFIDNGVNITISTDDPSVCNVKLKDELKSISETFNLSYSDIVKLQLNAINASFADEVTKKEVIDLLMSDLSNI